MSPVIPVSVEPVQERIEVLMIVTLISLKKDGELPHCFDALENRLLLVLVRDLEVSQVENVHFDECPFFLKNFNLTLVL